MWSVWISDRPVGVLCSWVSWIESKEPDVYLDALWGPLYFRMERVQKDGDSSPRISDYFLVSLFLLLNLALQLAIALKIDQVTLETYGDLGRTLLQDACWRVSDHPEFVGLLYPQADTNQDSSNFDFDCIQPVMTLSMFPSHLDLNHDGIWSTEECIQLEEKLRGSGSKMVNHMDEVLTRMAAFDKKYRPGSKSNVTSTGSFVDLGFFKTYGGQIQACLPVDPNLCGNLEAQQRLKDLLPWLRTSHERVEKCRQMFEDFCAQIFGGDYRWIHYETSKHCGNANFERANGVNVVQHNTVQTYKGASNSILSQTFVSFLVLLLFIWLMLMLSEFRTIWNFLYVIWYTPSTSNEDPHFGSVDEENFKLRELPIGHKVFVLLGILLPRCDSTKIDEDLPSVLASVVFLVAIVSAVLMGPLCPTSVDVVLLFFLVLWLLLVGGCVYSFVGGTGCGMAGCLFFWVSCVVGSVAGVVFFVVTIVVAGGPAAEDDNKSL